MNPLKRIDDRFVMDFDHLEKSLMIKVKCLSLSIQTIQVEEHGQKRN